MSLTGARTRRLGACVALAVFVTGCTVPFENLNDVDTARRAQLQTDPWIDANLVSVAGPLPGSNLIYDPAWATGSRYGLGSFTEVANAELAAARAQGWEPVYGRCPVPPGVDLDRRTVDESLSADVSINGKQSGRLVMIRPTGDGATAVAIVNLVRVTQTLVAFSEAYEITLSAAVPHHATIPSAPPPVVGLDSLMCLGTGDQWVIGDPDAQFAEGW